MHVYMFQCILIKYTKPCVCVCMLQSLQLGQLFVNLWTMAHKALLSMGFSNHEYWSRFPFLLQGIFLIQGSKSLSLASPELKADSLC